MPPKHNGLTFLPTTFSDELCGQAAAAFHWAAGLDTQGPRVVATFPAWFQFAQLALTGTPTGERVAHSGGETSDPTLSTVIGREHAISHAEAVIGHLLEARAHLKAAEALMARQTRKGNAVELEAVAKAARCTGGTNVTGYYERQDPTCQRNAVRDGLCSIHLGEVSAWLAAGKPRKAEDGAVALLTVLKDTNRAASAHNLVNDAARIERSA